MLNATPDWVLRLRTLADEPPLRERVSVRWGGVEIGDAENAILQRIAHAFDYQRQTVLRRDASGEAWHIDGDLTETLARIALVMRDLNIADAWRNEQLAVLDVRGHRLGTMERAAVRALGLQTRAVHLFGETSDGQYWVQQRSLTKSNEPGLWDTLMGGMVTAVDTLETALARETWEEAGLHVGDMFGLTHGGMVQVHRPNASGGGYIRERVDWFRATVPANLVPNNQDGEVAQFAKVPRASLEAGVAAGRFTLEAGLVIAAALGY